MRELNPSARSAVEGKTVEADETYHRRQGKEQAAQQAQPRTSALLAKRSRSRSLSAAAGCGRTTSPTSLPDAAPDPDGADR